MTKVKELRDELEKDIAVDAIGHHVYGDVADDIDSLIAAANEEGCDDGWAASKMLWTRMQEWNKEWQKENPKERSLTLLDAVDLIEWKLAKAREEGAERERERIVRLSDTCKEGDRLDSGTGSYFLADTMVATTNVLIIPDFLLSLAPTEPEVKP